MMADLLALLDIWLRRTVPAWEWWRYNHVTWSDETGKTYSAWRWELPEAETGEPRYCDRCGSQVDA